MHGACEVSCHGISDGVRYFLRMRVMHAMAQPPLLLHLRATASSVASC